MLALVHFHMHVALESIRHTLMVLAAVPRIVENIVLFPTLAACLVTLICFDTLAFLCGLVDEELAGS